MLELPPDVEMQLREKAARNGQDVGDYLRLILNQQASTNGEIGLLKPEDYPREGEDWTDEEMRRELEWANGKRFSA